MIQVGGTGARGGPRGPRRAGAQVAGLGRITASLGVSSRGGGGGQRRRGGPVTRLKKSLWLLVSGGVGWGAASRVTRVHGSGPP